MAARIAFSILADSPGLLPVMPHGAMYLMCGIEFSCFPEYKNDIDWTRALMKEESVICLPATVSQSLKLLLVNLFLDRTLFLLFVVLPVS